MHVLALANQKGGCGKTTTAIHLAGALATLGERVLLVDLDPQAHATLGLGVGLAPDEASVVDVLRGDQRFGAVLREVAGGVWIAPATLGLAEFEDECARRLHPERALERALAALPDFDRVLIDCPPRADGVLTANAIRAADTVCLVVETGAFALQGALRARALFDELADGLDRAPDLRVIATLFDRRTRFAREVLVGLHARFGDELFDTAIRSSTRLREAAAYGVPIQVLEPRSRAAADFASLAREVRAAEAPLVVSATLVPRPPAGDALRPTAPGHP